MSSIRSNSVQQPKKGIANKKPSGTAQAQKSAKDLKANDQPNIADQAKKLKEEVASKFTKGPSSKEKKLSVEELVKERLKLQPELLKGYPDMPVITPGEINTYQDYAYAVHDQAEFLKDAMDEIKIMHETHFMTKRNKLLMQEKKALEAEMELKTSSMDASFK